jgi:hypothetical protein
LAEGVSIGRAARIDRRDGGYAVAHRSVIEKYRVHRLSQDEAVQVPFAGACDPGLAFGNVLAPDEHDEGPVDAIPVHGLPASDWQTGRLAGGRLDPQLPVRRRSYSVASRLPSAAVVSATA